MTRAPSSPTQNRKTHHIDISLSRDVSGGLSTGFERYRFEHQALPEINMDEVDCAVEFLGKTLGAPLLISSMVGGVSEGEIINRNLAEAAQDLGLAMGVGSQRCALEDPSTARTFRVRDIAPDILLFANLGAVQLNYGYGPDHCRRAVDMIEADALVLHLNPLQEALQPEGDRNFSGLLKKMESLCRTLHVPVIVKEVGCGIAERTAAHLAGAGVACIDVGGAGGTSWSEVEKHRAVTDLERTVAGNFYRWGIPTADSIIAARCGAPGTPLIASGGIRDAMDAAKALALGASIAGIAMPLLAPGARSAEAVTESLRAIIETLRALLFCLGMKSPRELQDTPLLKKSI